MEIEIGIDFNEAEKESAIKPLPDGYYEMQVAAVEPKECGPNSKKPGRPMLSYRFEVVGNEEIAYNGRSVFYNVMIPWTDDSGEFDKSGISFLVGLCAAIGQPWEGSSFDPLEHIGATCNALIGSREYNGNVNNEIKKLVPSS